MYNNSRPGIPPGRAPPPPEDNSGQDDYAQYAPQQQMYTTSTFLNTPSTTQHVQSLPHQQPLTFQHQALDIQNPQVPSFSQPQPQQSFFHDYQHDMTPSKNHMPYARTFDQSPPLSFQQENQQLGYDPESPRLSSSHFAPVALPTSIPPMPALGMYSQLSSQMNPMDTSKSPFEMHRQQETYQTPSPNFDPQLRPKDYQQHMYQPPPAHRDGSQVQQFSVMQPPQMHHQQQEERQASQGTSFSRMSINGASSNPVSHGIGGMPGVPMLLAGMAQQLVSQGTGGAVNAADIAPHLMQNLGVSQYFSSSPQDSANTFMRFPKRYFAVNHTYVLKKLVLLLVPFTKRSWSRKRVVEHVHFDSSTVDSSIHAFVPPRDDVNAPDLYIPVMAFVSYVLLVGFIFGTQNAFAADVLARYCSKGLGVLTLEVLIIKLGLYLINAQPTPWFDVVAYRGYKFVGVIGAMIANFINPKLYLLSFGYVAIAMFVFQLRSHRRIILPREMDQHLPADIAQRNAFLLFICALQFPIYWLLILDVRSIVTS